MEVKLMYVTGFTLVKIRSKFWQDIIWSIPKELRIITKQMRNYLKNLNIPLEYTQVVPPKKQ